jgi:hypothetical protein
MCWKVDFVDNRRILPERWDVKPWQKLQFEQENGVKERIFGISGEKEDNGKRKTDDG